MLAPASFIPARSSWHCAQDRMIWRIRVSNRRARPRRRGARRRPRAACHGIAARHGWPDLAFRRVSGGAVRRAGLGSALGDALVQGQGAVQRPVHDIVSVRDAAHRNGGLAKDSNQILGEWLKWIRRLATSIEISQAVIGDTNMPALDHWATRIASRAAAVIGAPAINQMAAQASRRTGSVTMGPFRGERPDH
jgi:hypothetical protein